MAKQLLIDTLLVNIFVPADLPRERDREVRRTLQSKRFMRAIDVAMKEIFRRHETLKHATFRIDR